MEKALPLELVAFDSAKAESGDISDMSAEEYLSWVKHQADNLPLVSRVEIDRTKSASKPQTKLIHESVLLSSRCPNKHLPNEQWERDILFSFSELRGYIYRKNESREDKTRKVAVPAMKDSNGWMIFCLGKVDAMKLSTFVSNENEINDRVNESDLLRKRKREVLQIVEFDLTEDKSLNVPVNMNDDELLDDHLDADDDSDDNNEGNESKHGVEEKFEQNVMTAPSSSTLQPQQWCGQEKMAPSLDLLLQFDQVLTQKLLGHHIDWLSATKDLFISAKQGVWLYALLAKLEKPLCRDIAASIRQLFRLCANQRANLDMSSSSSSISMSAGSDSSSNGISGISNDKLAVLNTIICITGSYFGQSEEYDSRQIVSDNDHHSANGNDEEDEDENDDYEEEKRIQPTEGEEDEEEVEEGEEYEETNGDSVTRHELEDGEEHD